MADYDIGEAFRAIEHELIASMTRNLTNHKVEELVEGYEWAQWQAMQLEALEEYKRRNAAKFPKQFSDINSRIEQEINTSYSAAQTAQEREILKRIHNGTPAPSAPFTGIQGEFFKVNDRKMNALTDAVTNDMQKAEYAVLRMTNDKYRQIIFNAQVYANSGAATYEKAVDMATKDFLSAGINCIQYKDGRRVPIDAYAEMALRTANKRAYLLGEGDMRKKWGIHTVILNKRTNACPKCAPFCGQIIVDDVWSGGTAEEAEKGGYLLMSDCIAHGLYHPNCQDSHTTYFGDLLGDDEDEEQTESEIMPLPENEVQANTDSAEYLLQQYTPEEQERNIELYNAQQRLNHCERQVQRFERLEDFSLDEGNRAVYSARRSEWKNRLLEAKNIAAGLVKSVAFSAGSGIIEARRVIPATQEEIKAFEESLKELGLADVSGFETYIESNKYLLEIVEDFRKLKSDFPDYFQGLKLNLGVIEEMTESDYACYDRRTGTIHLNPSYYNDFNTFISSFADDVRGKYHPVGTNYRSVIFHEFGHMVEFVSGINRKALLKKLFVRFNNRYFTAKLCLAWVSLNLSYYAPYNDYIEFISEAFAEYYNSPNPRDLCKAVLGFILGGE